MISIKIDNKEFNNVDNFLIKYIKENTTCKINENDKVDLTIIVEQSPMSPAYYFINNELIIHLWDDIVDEEYLKIICKTMFQKFDIDSLDYDLPFKDIESISDIEDKLAANYDKDNDNKIYFKGKDEPTIELHTARRAKGSLYYFTRRSFNDEESEKYSGPSLVKAVSECDKYAGMCVFNDSGKLIYKSTKNKLTPTQNYSDYTTKRAVINTPTGTGIYVSNEGKRYHIPNGTEVIVSKINNSKSEIIVNIMNEKLKIEVDSSCLL